MSIVQADDDFARSAPFPRLSKLVEDEETAATKVKLERVGTGEIFRARQIKTELHIGEQFFESGNYRERQSKDQAGDQTQMDIYKDLILRHLIKDISSTCTKLRLPTGLFTQKRF